MNSYQQVLTTSTDYLGERLYDGKFHFVTYLYPSKYCSTRWQMERAYGGPYWFVGQSHWRTPRHCSKHSSWGRECISHLSKEITQHGSFVWTLETARFISGIYVHGGNVQYVILEGTAWLGYHSPSHLEICYSYILGLGYINCMVAVIWAPFLGSMHDMLT